MSAIAKDLSDLAYLSQDPDLADPGEVIRSVTAQLMASTTILSEEKRETFGKVLVDLCAKADLDQKIELSEHIARFLQAPSNLIRHLAADHIAVAAPILSHCTGLSEDDLVSIAQHATNDHRQAIAARSDVSAVIASILIDKGDEYSWKTLANNHNAKISDEDLTRLVSISKHTLLVRLPLLQRPGLPKRQALRIANWASENVRQFVELRFERLGDDTPPSPQNKEETPQERASLEVAALKSQGRLTPPVLVRALHRHDDELFFTAFASLVDIAQDQIRRLLAGERATPMALACRAMGVDQGQFETLYTLYRRRQKAPFRIEGRDRTEITKIFSGLSPDNARQAVHGMV